MLTLHLEFDTLTHDNKLKFKPFRDPDQFIAVFNIRGQTLNVLKDQDLSPFFGSNHNFVIKSDKGQRTRRKDMTGLSRDKGKGRL